MLPAPGLRTLHALGGEGAGWGDEAVLVVIVGAVAAFYLYALHARRKRGG